MSSILLKGIIHNGRVELPGRINLPDGTEVVVTTVLSFPVDDGPISQTDLARMRAVMVRLKSFDFMTEDEHGDDPKLIEEWIDDLRSIPPMVENQGNEADWKAWDEKMRQFNVEAVRKQFEEGKP
jgi:hypothetical protein